MAIQQLKLPTETASITQGDKVLEEPVSKAKTEDELIFDIMELPEMKAVIEFFRERVESVIGSRESTDFIKKLKLKPLTADYKKLKLATQELMMVHGLVNNDPDNTQAVEDRNHCVEKLTDHIQYCLARYNIEVKP